MKYLAILRDSLLEAIDSKVFYVLLGLALFTVILVGSISFKPVAVEDDASRFAEVFNWSADSLGHQQGIPKGSLRFSVEDFTSTKDGAKVQREENKEPWTCDYSFLLVVKVAANNESESSSFDELGVATAMGMGFQKGLQAYLSYLKNVQVSAEPSTASGELRFRVSTHGSNVEQREEWPHNLKVLFAVPISRDMRFPLHNYIEFIEDILVNTWGASIALLLSIVITAFFIPNMLRKGSIDLLLVKPINRVTLLCYKYIGGMSFMFLTTVVTVMGIWIVMGLRTGTWGLGFLVSIFVLTFEFAIFYAVSTLFAVLTRSAIVCILMACLTWAILFVVGWGYRIIDSTRKLDQIIAVQEAKDAEKGIKKERPPLPPEKPLPDWAYTTADIVHFVLPRMKDLDVLTTRAIDHDNLPANNIDRKAADKLTEEINWWEAFVVSGLYIVLFLSIGCWRFAVKDY